jgi:hypothetical protein
MFFYIVPFIYNVSIFEIFGANIFDFLYLAAWPNGKGIRPNPKIVSLSPSMVEKI